MMMRSILMGVAVAALAAPVLAATNLLPNGTATVSGYSSIHSGFDPVQAAKNLVNGGTKQTYYNGDTRWVFDDSAAGSTDQYIIVDLGKAEAFDFAGYAASTADRIPTSFSVEYSTDGTNFSDVTGASASNGGLSFKTVDAQYVEYLFGDGSTTTGCPGCGGGPGQGAGISSLALAVPEPAAWAMMLLGVGMIGAGLRMARRKNDMALTTA